MPSFFTLFTPEEDDSILNWMAEHTKDIKQPIAMSELCQRFVEETGTTRTSISVQNRFRYRLAPKIQVVGDLDLNTRVRLIYMTGTRVNEHFLRELRADAEVEVDENGRITKYSSGELMLVLQKAFAMRNRKSTQKRQKPIAEDGQGTSEEVIKRKRGRPPNREKPKAPANNAWAMDLYGNEINILTDGEERWDRSGKLRHVDESPRIEGVSEQEAPGQEREEEKNSPMMGMFMESLKQMIEKQTTIMQRLLKAEEPTTSKKTFLQALRTLISEIGDPEMAGTLQKVNESLQIMGYSDEEIPTKSIRAAIEQLLAKFLN
ncbi:unnamed protein product [Caenorhabditis sp. 36 PRJEB53466]|nr:unnamed protein product [Caenorhabditis sp. 36 PRJEB53466]